MKTGITEYYLRQYGLQDGLRRMRLHGYECLDCQHFLETDTELFAVSEPEFEAEVLRFSQIVKAEGITINQAHGPWRYPPRDAAPEDRQERFEKMVKSFRGSALLGCPYVVIHPLMPFGCGGNEPRKMRDINFEFMSRLCKEARKYGITVCLENMPMPDLPIASPQDVLQFIQELNQPNCKVCLDTGHSAVVGVQPADAVRAIGKDLLAVLHVHDNDGMGDLHRPPYTGVNDWDAFVQALQEIQFEGSISIETKIPAGLPDDRREEQELFLAHAAKKIAGRA